MGVSNVDSAGRVVLPTAFSAVFFGSTNLIDTTYIELVLY